MVVVEEEAAVCEIVCPEDPDVDASEREVETGGGSTAAALLPRSRQPDASQRRESENGGRGVSFGTIEVREFAQHRPPQEAAIGLLSLPEVPARQQVARRHTCAR